MIKFHVGQRVEIISTDKSWNDYNGEIATVLRVIWGEPPRFSRAAWQYVLDVKNPNYPNYFLCSVGDGLKPYDERPPNQRTTWDQVLWEPEDLRT